MPVDRLSAEDRLMLEADALWPQDVGALLMLDGAALLDVDGSVDLERLCHVIEARLHLVPRLRQTIHVPRRGLGGPLWVDAPHFDIHDHIRINPLPHGADEAELHHAVADLRRERLPRSRPLWEMCVLTGLADGRLGVFVRYHHAIADGRAAMAMLAAFLELGVAVPSGPAPAWTPANVPLSSDMAADAFVRRLHSTVGVLKRAARPRSVLAALRMTAVQARELLGDGPASQTSLNRLAGRERSFAVLSASLAEVREMAHRYGATPNDVLVSLTAAGLRAVLTGRGEPVPTLKVRAYAPVSLRQARRGASEGNLISQMVLHLPVAEADAAERLRRVAAETTRNKSIPRASMGTWFGLNVVRSLMIKAFARQRVNTVITTVHGPRRPAYLAGARLLELFPMLNLFGNQTLGVGALSYGDGFYIGMTADRETYPDLDVLAAAMAAELDALRVVSRHAKGGTALAGAGPTACHGRRRKTPCR